MKLTILLLSFFLFLAVGCHKPKPKTPPPPCAPDLFGCWVDVVPTADARKVKP